MSEEFRFDELSAAQCESPRERELSSAYGALVESHEAMIADFKSDGAITMQSLNLIPDGLDLDDTDDKYAYILMLNMLKNLGVKADIQPEPGHDIEWETYSNFTVRITSIVRDNNREPVHVLTHYATDTKDIVNVWLLNNESAQIEIDNIHESRRTTTIQNRLIKELKQPGANIPEGLTLDEKQLIINDFDTIQRALMVPVINKKHLKTLRRRVTKTMIPFVSHRGNDKKLNKRVGSYLDFIDYSVISHDIDSESEAELIRSERQQRLLALDKRLSYKMIQKEIGHRVVNFLALITVTATSAVAGRIAQTSYGLPVDALETAAVASAGMGISCIFALRNYTKRVHKEVKSFSSIPVPPSPHILKQLDQEYIIARSDLNTLKF